MRHNNWAFATAFALTYGLLAVRAAQVHFAATHSDATLEYSFILLGLLLLSLGASALLWRDVRALRGKPEAALKVLRTVRVVFAGAGLAAALPLCALVLTDFVCGCV